VRNAATSCDGCFSLGIPLALLVRIRLVIGRRVQERQENRIGAKVVRPDSCGSTK